MSRDDYIRIDARIGTVVKQRVTVDYRSETKTVQYDGFSDLPHTLGTATVNHPIRADFEANLEIEIHLPRLREMIKKAFHSKRKQSKSGAVVVKLFNVKQLSEAVEE